MQAAASPSPALPKLILYLLIVMIGGALLAAPLFHLGQWAYAWLPTSPLQGTGFSKWLMKEIERAHFSRYFNRAVLICALAFIGPFLKWVKLDRSLMPVWAPWKTGLKHWVIGFGLASALLLALGWLFVWQGAYILRSDVSWLKLGEPSTAALGASTIEEFFFRGLLLGLLLRTMSQRTALFWGTFIFAIVHFLKPPEGWQIEDSAVMWSSGFLVLKQIAIGFGDVEFLLAEFATLFAVGWVLSQARMHTGALWTSMGLHAGWIFGLKYFSALTSQSGNWLPWIGANLKIGLLPLVTVLLTGWIALKLIPARPPIERAQ